MREIRLYGSEGGVAFGPSLPLSRVWEQVLNKLRSLRLEAWIENSIDARFHVLEVEQRNTVFGFSLGGFYGGEQGLQFTARQRRQIRSGIRSVGVGAEQFDMGALEIAPVKVDFDRILGQFTPDA